MEVDVFHRGLDTHLAQESEKLKEEPGEGGGVAGVAAASHQQAEPGDPQRLLLLCPADLTQRSLRDTLELETYRE